MSITQHNWRFFRAGDFEQPLLTCAADLKALRQLDQKLWATLACPATRLALPEKFLHMLDDNHDGRIRAPEVLTAIDWTLERLTDPDCLFTQRPLVLSDLTDSEDNHSLILAARRLLELLGRTDKDSLSAEDTLDPAVIFPVTAANGDGLIPAGLSTEPDIQELIETLITCVGSETDRSGEPGISAEHIDDFFSQADALRDWHQSASDEVRLPFGERTEQVIGLLSRLRDKVNDFFTRVELVAYDPRAATIMAAGEEELTRLGAGSLASLDSLQDLPLANLQQEGGIAFASGINPAWQADMQALYEAAVEPAFGAVTHLTPEHWQQLMDTAAPWYAWQADKPDVALLEHLELDYILAMDVAQRRSQLEQLVALDLEVAEAAQGWVDLDRLLNMQAHLVPLLKNFVSFEHFYGHQDKATFQAGRLFIDGKSCDLVVEVDDIDAHSTIASQSNSYLIYCHCTRRGQPVNDREACNIVALVSAGADHELMPGRNGLFYDRDGNDWDATVVKVIENAISVREAFWSPYRRIANLISEQIQKLAAGQDEQLMSKAAANVEAGSNAPAPFDIAKFAGIFAAIGMALGALGTAFAATFAGLLSLTWWQWPLVFVGLIAIISGPSMLLAWFKLRRRSLGPILDANGWAVNAQARISILFGASLTQLASLPKGSARSLRDPYANRSSLRWWLLAVLIIVLVGGWYYSDQVQVMLGIAEPAVVEPTAIGEAAEAANAEPTLD